MEGDFRRAAVAVGAALLLGGAAAVAVATDGGGGRDGGDGRARNLILLIGDGMGPTHVEAARLRYHGAAGRLSMERAPSHGTVTTDAVEERSRRRDPVTDSAAAATAWSSGVKTYDGAIGKDAWGRVVPTLMEQAKAAGMRTGDVTDAEVTDATPAAMLAHVSRRACQGPGRSGCTDGDRPIAEQIAAGATADVILGGGLSRFEPEDEGRLRASGYRILAGDGAMGDAALAAQTAASQRVATRAQLRRLRARPGNGTRVIGLFGRGDMTVGRPGRIDPAAPEPSVGEMTRTAIRLLSRSAQGRRNGFLLQVEGALIDKRSHAGDAARALDTVRELDDAVEAAVDFARRDGETLVIVTADHETGGLDIVAKGSSSDSDAAPATLRTADDPPAVADGDPGASLRLSFESGDHTGRDVPIFAFGPEHRLFRGRQDNTDLYDKMRGALARLHG